MKKKKLVVIIPCFNEEKGLEQLLASFPRKIENINQVEIIVINDGSTDQTKQVAQKAKLKLITHRKRRGLAKTFKEGLRAALKIKADIIVNLDGDNQYNPQEIPKLIKPLLEEKADMVLGNRRIKTLTHMPFTKKFGNTLGSWVIRLLTGSKVQDASTGFRAFSRQIAESFHLISDHTYTHETIIQAVYGNFEVVEIPIQFKKREFGQSKLIKNLWLHIKNSAAIIVRTILIYRAFKYLLLSGLGIMCLGFLGTLRFLWFYLSGNGDGHIQSLVLSSILISIGFSTIIMGVLADLISINKKLIEEIKAKLR